MHFVCSYISKYFSIYDDEYGRTYYDDDDDHASHDTQDLLTSRCRYRQLVRHDGSRSV